MSEDLWPTGLLDGVEHLLPRDGDAASTAKPRYFDVDGAVSSGSPTPRWLPGVVAAAEARDCSWRRVGDVLEVILAVPFSSKFATTGVGSALFQHAVGSTLRRRCLEDSTASTVSVDVVADPPPAVTVAMVRCRRANGNLVPSGMVWQAPRGLLKAAADIVDQLGDLDDAAAAALTTSLYHLPEAEVAAALAARRERFRLLEVAATSQRQSSTWRVETLAAAVACPTAEALTKFCDLRRRGGDADAAKAAKVDDASVEVVRRYCDALDAGEVVAVVAAATAGRRKVESGWVCDVADVEARATEWLRRRGGRFERLEVD